MSGDELGKTAPSKKPRGGVVLLVFVGGIAAGALLSMPFRETDERPDSAGGMTVQTPATPELAGRITPSGDVNVSAGGPEEGHAPSVVRVSDDFSLFGDPDGTGKPIQRDRCSAASKIEMASRTHETDEGDVLVGDSWWGTLATMKRAGIADWLSQCMHEGRSVRIRSKESGAILATYDPRTGYKPGRAELSRL